MSPLAKQGDTIEQSYCRERTEEEQRGVEQSQILRMLLRAGAHEVRLSTKKPWEID